MELEPLFDIGILPPPLPPSPAQSPALFDLTPYLLMPQRTVAKMLGLPMSTLSKRWRIAGKGRIWPYRRIQRLGTDERERKRLLKPTFISIARNKK